MNINSFKLKFRIIQTFKKVLTCSNPSQSVCICKVADSINEVVCIKLMAPPTPIDTVWFLSSVFLTSSEFSALLLEILKLLSNIIPESDPLACVAHFTMP